ncbi:OsmC family protein [Klebsiella quasipneumoniae]|nr:OsmC family protein [Klebsiella quasipneumoniae]
MEHAYTSHITWTGNQGTGTSGYKAYARTWDIAVKGKEPFIVQMIHYWAAIPAK